MKNLLFYTFPVFCFLLLTGCGEASPESAISRAAVLAQKGEWKKAAKIADRTARKHPELAAAHILRAVTHEQCGNRDIALDAAGRAAKLEPDNFIAQYTLGRMYAQDPARSSEAQRVLTRSLGLRRSNDAGRILLCNVVMDANLPNALSYLGMISRIPGMTESAEYWNQRAVCYVRRGDLTNAEKSFLRAIRCDEKNPEIIINVARFYDGCMRHRRNAVKLYRSYLALTDADPAGRAEAGARLAVLDPR